MKSHYPNYCMNTTTMFCYHLGQNKTVANDYSSQVKFKICKYYPTTPT